MSTEDKKRQVAEAAVQYVEPNSIIGVGTGTTTNLFIKAVAAKGVPLEGAVASSEATAEQLKAAGIPVLNLNSTGNLSLYVDGADETTRHLQLIKGGGGALTREKIIAAASQTFVCIVDESKQVDMLGQFPLPIEVIPMARSYVARQVSAMGGLPVWREGFITDNGNHILDVRNLNLIEPAQTEREINQITGVVCNGLFACRSADILLIGTDSGVQTLKV